MFKRYCNIWFTLIYKISAQIYPILKIVYTKLSTLNEEFAFSVYSKCTTLPFIVNHLIAALIQ